MCVISRIISRWWKIFHQEPDINQLFSVLKWINLTWSWGEQIEPIFLSSLKIMIVLQFEISRNLFNWIDDIYMTALWIDERKWGTTNSHHKSWTWAECFPPLTRDNRPLHTFELSTSLSTACQRLSEHIIVNLSILKTISWCLEKCYFVKIFKIIFKGGNIFDWRELEGKNFCQKYTRSFFIFCWILYKSCPDLVYFECCSQRLIGTKYDDERKTEYGFFLI